MRSNSQGYRSVRWNEFKRVVPKDVDVRTLHDDVRPSKFERHPIHGPDSSFGTTHLAYNPPPLCGALIHTTAEDEARLKEEAKNFKVTRLPYKGPRKDCRFDRRTYKRGKSYGLQQTIGAGNLSWSDFQNGMHMNHRATISEMRLLYTPVFANNDEDLRRVLAQQGWMYAKTHLAGTTRFYEVQTKEVPQGFVRNREALESLCNRATSAIRARGNSKGSNDAQHVAWCEKHGGYIALRTKIAYEAWRLSKNASVIAEELELTSDGVRMILFRLCETARYINLETFPRHHSCFQTLAVPADVPSIVKPDDEEEELPQRTDNDFAAYVAMRLAAAGHKPVQDKLLHANQIS